MRMEICWWVGDEGGVSLEEIEACFRLVLFWSFECLSFLHSTAFYAAKFSTRIVPPFSLREACEMQLKQL